ncbi:alpha/beta fold hydrolase, partial [Acinetobacter baumannii]
RVIRPNYAGSGATRDDGGPLSVAGLAGQVLAAADAAGADRFDLLGFSLGAAVAAYLAGEQPGRVRKLILLAGFVSSADTRLTTQFELWRH